MEEMTALSSENNKNISESKKRINMPLIISGDSKEGLRARVVNNGGRSMFEVPMNTANPVPSARMEEKAEEWSPSWKKPDALCLRPKDRALALCKQ